MSVSRPVARLSAGGLVLALVLALTLPAVVRPVEADTTWFVKRNATGANDGTSWDDAFVSLQSALAVAVDGDSIFVAAGTYIPSVPAGRYATFAIPDGVKLYGSFAGTESSIAQRTMPTAPTSILSGNRGVRGPADNTYHVVTVTGIATIDGFVIRDGNASGSTPNDRGGNLLALGSFGRFRNLQITRGNATWDAGGAYADGSHDLFEDVVFSYNTSERNGAGLTMLDDFSKVRNSTFLGNTSDADGALWIRGGGENLTFVGNQAGRGSAIATYGGATINGVTIHDNEATNGGGQGPFYSSVNGTLAVTNAILWGNTGQSTVGLESSSAQIEINGGIVESGCPATIACTNVVDLDPQLEAATAVHGGFVPTLAIAGTSPAVDAAPADGCLFDDARGVERPFDVGGNGGDACDFGAYEFVSLPTLGIHTEEVNDEGNSIHEFFVNPSHAYPETITADLVVTDGTATNGKDYLAAPGPIVIDPFQTVTVGAFQVFDDALDEPTETFELALTNIVNATPGESATIDVPIQDNDDPPSVKFTLAGSSGSEAATPAKLAVTLSAPSGQDIQVGYTVDGGSATAGEDYVAAAKPITIPAGATTGVLRLRVVNDWRPEPNETAVLKLSGLVNVTAGATPTHTYTIKNDDRVRFCQGQRVTIYGTPGKDRIAGTPKRDVIDGLGADDSIRGAGGNDVICGSGGKDVLRGGPGNDILNGGGAGDTLRGGGGNDTLLGKAGADTLHGELGRDRLAGGVGKPDACDGGPSTDSLLPAHGCETVSGVP